MTKASMLTLLLSAALFACDSGGDGPNDAGGPACTPSGLSCDPSEMCVRGGRCDGPGECVAIPTTCEPAAPSDEVCGCDGATYESTCHANQVGVDTSFGGATCL